MSSKMTLEYQTIVDRCPNRTEWLAAWFPTVKLSLYLTDGKLAGWSSAAYVPKRNKYVTYVVVSLTPARRKPSRPFQPYVVTSPITIHGNTIQKWITLVVIWRFSGTDSLKSTTENLRFATNIIHLCIFSSWVAAANDKFQQMVEMDKF